HRACSQGNGSDRTGFKVLMLPHPCGIYPLPLVEPAPVKIDKTRVQVPAFRNVRLREVAAYPTLYFGDHTGQDLWVGLGLDAAVLDPFWRVIIVEAGELPVPEPIDGPEQPALRLARRRWVVLGVALFPDRVERRKPVEDPLAPFLRHELRI